MRAHKGGIRRREKLLTVDQQAIIIRALDEGSLKEVFTQDEAEGLTALAMLFQHAVRPVQLVALCATDIVIMTEASEEQAAIISFHAAKQRDGDSIELVRQLKPEWVPPLKSLLGYALSAERPRLFSTGKPDALWAKVTLALKRSGAKVDFSPGHLRHTGAQTLADGGADRESIRKYLGHANISTANSYVKATRHHGEVINRALGISKLYGNVLALASSKFLSIDDLMNAEEDEQIGAVVGDRLIAGIGLCKSGQSNCKFNPVTSCYGCRKFMPSLDRQAHVEAVEGMRSQVHVYLAKDPTGQTQTAKQLIRSLAGAQVALQMIKDGSATRSAQP